MSLDQLERQPLLAENKNQNQIEHIENQANTATHNGAFLWKFV